MEPRPKFTSLPDWLARAYAFPGLHNILSRLVRVPCAIAPLLPGSHWAVLYNEPESTTLPDVENAFGKVVERQKYNLRNWAVAQRTRRTYLSELWGFSDLTVPVVVSGSVGALICSGPFLRKAPEAAAIERAFRALSGRPPRSLDPMFSAFVEIWLRTPVLDPSQLRAYRVFLEMAADVIAGKGDPRKQLAKMEKLRVRHFAKLPMTRSARAAQMIDPVKYAQWIAHKMELEYYDRDELGVTHFPNVALAVSRVATGTGKENPLINAIELAEFQSACVDFARTVPETLGTDLPDQGSYLLTWHDPRLRPSQRRADARKLADAVTAFARKKLRARVAIGIGGLGGEPVPECARQAVVAMQLAGHDEVPWIFYDDVAGRLSKTTGNRAVDVERRLIEAYFQSSRDEIAAVQAEYVHRVLEESRGSPSAARACFEHCLRGLIERTRAQGPLEEKIYLATIERLTEELAGAQSTTALVGAFRQWMIALAELRRSPAAVSVQLRLQRAADFVRERCHDDLSLGQVARQSGLSPAYFSHLFKTTFGSGFNHYLSECRLERARRLLSQTEMPVARVVNECGFGSLAHFHAVFKLATGTTPARFRGAQRVVGRR